MVRLTDDTPPRIDWAFSELDPTDITAMTNYHYDDAGNKVQDGKVVQRSRYDDLELNQNLHRVKDDHEYTDIAVEVDCTDGYHLVGYDDGTWEIWHYTTSVGQELVAISKEQVKVRTDS